MATLYSVFDSTGQGVTGGLWDTIAEAQEWIAQAKDETEEFGTLHAGIPCADHDEHEQGLCYHCARKPSYTFEATFTDNVDGYEMPALTICAPSYLEAYDKARLYAGLNGTRVHEVVNVF
jgi:hypothetical protein